MSKVIPEIKKIVVGPIQTNCYIVKCPISKKILVIDPGDDTDYIMQHINTLDAIVYTHGHFDHVGGSKGLVSSYGSKTYVHRADSEMMKTAAKHASDWGFRIEQPPVASNLLEDSDLLAVGSLSFKVIHTPGHSPGSICLEGHGVVFSGDTLFSGSIGRTDLPASSTTDMTSSLKRLARQLSSESTIYPGHGPSTIMSKEIKHNPFLSSI